MTIEQDVAMALAETNTNTEEISLFKEMVSGGFMPTLRLQTAMSKECKAGNFPINRYALVKGSNLDNLGEEVQIFVLAWRPLALDTVEGNTSHDMKSELFKDIQGRANVKDSGCMYGPEFLIYVPGRETYATLFMGSKTTRRESESLMARMYKAATLKVQHIETKKNDWFSIAVTPCSETFDMPDIEDVKSQVSKFKNPPTPQVELVDDDADEREV